MASLQPTGVDALDRFLQGGLPKGFTTLVLAPTGSGAEIFAKQFAAGRSGTPTVYVTTDESAEDVREALGVAGWPAKHIEIVDLQTAFAQQMLEAQRASLKGPTDRRRRAFDPRELVEGTSSRDILQKREERPMATPRPTAPQGGRDYLARLMDPFTQEDPPRRMVVHSLDFFLNLYPPEQVVAALTALKAANAHEGGHLLLVLAKGAHGSNLERRMELLADCLIELEMTRKGTAFERFFMVKKVKNRAHGVGVSTYEITPNGFQLETLERIV